MAIPRRVLIVFSAILTFAGLGKNFNEPAWAAQEDAISAVGTDAVKTEGVKTDEVKTDPVKTDPAKTGAVKPDPVRTDPVKTGAVKTGAVKTDAPQAGKTFGRIDEIGSSPLPGIGLSSDTKKYSGTVIGVYPEDLLGDWGGQLKIFSFKVSDSYRALDARTASQSVNLLRPGRIGASNFCFHKDSSGKIVLDPVRVALTVPLRETIAFTQMARRGQYSTADIARIGSQLAPLISIDFDSVHSNANNSGVGGGQFNTNVVKTTIRQLGPDVFEKQNFTKSVTRLPSKAVYRTVSENVIWFKVNPTDKNLYVRICGLEFSEKGQLLSKLVLSGTLLKGRRVETNNDILMRQKDNEMQSEINRLQGELNRLRQENSQ